jgi:hypothetical protein
MIFMKITNGHSVRVLVLATSSVKDSRGESLFSPPPTMLTDASAVSITNCIISNTVVIDNQVDGAEP